MRLTHRFIILNQEQIYIYVLNPYMFNPNGSKHIMEGSFEVSVSKEKGIISVKSLIQGVHQWGTDQVDTVYKLVLYPKVLFTNNKGNTLDL